MIVYALLDPRTCQIRYIGASTKGLIRPLTHRNFTHNAALATWLKDLKACGGTYAVVLLAEATTKDQLGMLEAHWIALGTRFGWPLTNKQHPTDNLPAIQPPSAPWKVENWRRDPEVKEALARARDKRR